MLTFMSSAQPFNPVCINSPHNDALHVQYEEEACAHSSTTDLVDSNVSVLVLS